MCEHGTETILTLPDDIDPDRQNRTVSIDSCISTTIELIWKAGLQTRGSCCGHFKERPSIVVPAEMSAEDIALIRHHCWLFDSRPWKILQWQLVEAVNNTQDAATVSAQH